MAVQFNFVLFEKKIAPPGPIDDANEEVNKSFHICTRQAGCEAVFISENALLSPIRAAELGQLFQEV